MGDSLLSSIAWLGLANAAVSALLVVMALVCTHWSRSTTLVSALWTLAILKLISPAFANVPIPLPELAWAATDTARTAAETTSPAKPAAVLGRSGSKSQRTSAAANAGRSIAWADAPRPAAMNWSALLTTFAAVWILGIVGLASIALARIAALRRLVHRAQPAPNWILLEVAECCGKLGLRRVPDVRMLEIAISPLVGTVGWTPVLLLPKHFYSELSKNERQLLLAHEIAHLRRWDHVRAWLELVAVTLFWWDPLAWFARRRSREAAENCCDSWVVHWFPERAADYAEVLLKCVDLCNPPARRLPGPMSAMSRFALTRQRLLAILASPRPPQMSRLGTVAVLAIALVLLSSIPVVGNRTPPAENVTAISIASRPARATAVKSQPFFVDLRPHANVRLDEDFGRNLHNNLGSLPPGRQTFGGVEYQVGDRFILLASQIAKTRPTAATGIKLGRQIDSLKVLHGAGWSPEDDGTEIGSYIVHYAGGATEKIPIVYGVDVRDWWNIDEDFPVTRGRVVWRGDNVASSRFRRNALMLRLYELSWTNPHPDRVIETIDFVSTNSSECAPFLVAMTADERLTSD
jgi:beta-lactamase regulating signal transducer with metallopeptidase domain